MVTDIDAILVYGYNLGGPGHWLLKDLGRGERLGRSWLTKGLDFSDAVMRELPVELGITCIPYGGEGGCCDVNYLLSAKTYSTYFSHALPICAAGFDIDPEWDRRLATAHTILAVRPTAPAGWHLAASYGL